MIYGANRLKKKLIKSLMNSGQSPRIPFLFPYVKSDHPEESDDVTLYLNKY